MAKTFNLPAVGDTMQEGEIVEWFVAVGDEVTLDQTICSLETDKSVVEMTTPYRGTVLYIAGPPGDVVSVGSPLIIVGDAGETYSPPATPTPTPTPTAAPAPAPAPEQAPQALDRRQKKPVVLSPIVRRMAKDYGVDLGLVVGSGPGGRILRHDVEALRDASFQATPDRRLLAMPKVRKLAREQSIDLTSLSGTGPNGSVTVADVTASNRSGIQGRERRVRLSAMRRSIAAHLTESAREIPQFTSMVDVDASALVATREALGERDGAPMPIDALFIAMMVPVLVDHPLMTATLDGDDIVYHDRYDIGIAVDTQDGLMVPVIHDAETFTIDELGARVRELASAARDRTVAPQDLAGATCTLNNIGALGLLAGTPILPLGTSMILATGRTRPVVELRDGAPVAVPTMTLSATFDHRLVDGGDSARFLTQLKRHLEVPALGLL